MKNVLITGASGITGQIISKKLLKKGYNIKHLSSNYPFKINKYPTYYWNTFNKKINLKALNNIDIIIHLAGTPIFQKKWNKDQKNKIFKSRINGIKILLDSIKKQNNLPKLFLYASGINYYGYNNIENYIDENNPPGKDFLSIVTNLCELSVKKIEILGIRVVQFRTGIILYKKSKILNILNKIINFYLGAPLGSGNQFIPWIHIYDLCNIYIKAIEDEKLIGIYNTVAPEQVTNKFFIKKLAFFLNKPLFFPKIPEFIIRLIYGEISNIILKGNSISIKKLLKTKYIFEYPTLEKAFTEIYYH